MRKLSFADADLKIAAQEAWEAMAESLSDINHDDLGIPAGFKEQIMRMAKQYWDNEETGKRQRRRSALLRAAAIFIAILIGVSTFLAINTEARAVVQEWFKEVYDRLVVYRFDAEPVDKPFPYYEPAWLPEGFREIDRFPNEEFGSNGIVYRNDETGATVIFDYDCYDDDPVTVEPQSEEGMIHETVTVNGLPGDFYDDSEGFPSCLVWIDEKEQIVFSINSVLGRDDILRIAESVRETPPPPAPLTFEPGWLPEGYTTTGSGKSTGSRSVRYTKDGPQDALWLEYTFLEKVPVFIEPEPAEDAVCETVTVQGFDARLYVSPDPEAQKLLIWTDTGYNAIFVIKGTQDRDTLLRVAESIRPVG